MKCQTLRQQAGSRKGSSLILPRRVCYKDSPGPLSNEFSVPIWGIAVRAGRGLVDVTSSEVSNKCEECLSWGVGDSHRVRVLLRLTGKPWCVPHDHFAYSPSFVSASGLLAALSGNALPAGIRLRTALIYNAYGFVLGANFFAYQGAVTLGQAQMLIKDILGPAVSGVAFGSAPILAFQLLLVGTGNHSTRTFAQGGSGILRYKATSRLQATTRLLECRLPR
jgi:hypothetical protein